MRPILFLLIIHLQISVSFCISIVTSKFELVKVSQDQWEPELNKTVESTIHCSVLCQGTFEIYWCNSFQLVPIHANFSQCQMSSNEFVNGSLTTNGSDLVHVYAKTFDSRPDNRNALMILQRKFLKITADILTDNLTMCKVDMVPTLDGTDLPPKSEFGDFGYTKHKGIIITCGGYDKANSVPLEQCLYWSLEDKNQTVWNNSLTLARHSKRPLAISTERNVYFIGGEDTGSFVHKFDSELMTVERITYPNGTTVLTGILFKLFNNRHKHALKNAELRLYSSMLSLTCGLALNDQEIVIIGGRRGKAGTIRDVTLINTLSWNKTSLPPLNEARGNPACGVVKWNGKTVIMVAGGRMAGGTNVIGLETLDVRLLNKWVSHGSMDAHKFVPTAQILPWIPNRGGAASGFLPVFGFETGLMFLDPENLKWEKVDSLSFSTVPYNTVLINVERWRFEHCFT